MIPSPVLVIGCFLKIIQVTVYNVAENLQFIWFLVVDAQAIDERVFGSEVVALPNLNDT